ncbi:MAG: enoyl-CoA hydratase/isomerase family protein [Candidatus Sericytochromatia bacterium]|nr:enoyl-CoA hydratase/isomerase family protein [Candidatus Sericytochromatia bacterium]
MSLRFEQHGAIGVLTLDRPDKLNAMSHEMGDALAAAVASLAGAPGLRCLLLRAEGRAFSAGGDLAFLEANRARTEAENQADMRSFYAKFLTIQDAPVPTIALVQGRATGAGMCLALACDIRIAADDALLSFNFVRIGLTPGMGGTWTLPRLVGPSRAAELAFTGRTVDAPEALVMGLVSRVVPGAELLAQGLALAEAIGTASPQAVRATRRLLAQAPGLSLGEALDREAAAQAVAFASDDLREGLSAVKERRPPAFS